MCALIVGSGAPLGDVSAICSGGLLTRPSQGFFASQSGLSLGILPNLKSMCPVQCKACEVVRVAGKCQAYEREPQYWVGNAQDS